MKRKALDAVSQQALDYLLHGEFGFHGLISTRRNLPAPVLEWHYRRTAAHTWRTVSCISTRGVPHGDDLAIFQALLSLYVGHPFRYRNWSGICTSLEVSSLEQPPLPIPD